MAFKTKQSRVLIDEAAKFTKKEIEFLLTLIQESMIPGKFLSQAMNVVQKLRNQYKMIDLPSWEVRDMKPDEEVKERAKRALTEKDGELWMKDE